MTKEEEVKYVQSLTEYEIKNYMIITAMCDPLVYEKLKNELIRREGNG